MSGLFMHGEKVTSEGAIRTKVIEVVVANIFLDRDTLHILIATAVRELVESTTVFTITIRDVDGMINVTVHFPGTVDVKILIPIVH